MMRTLSMIFGFASILMMAYVLYTFYTSYKEVAAMPGEWKPWERFWAVAQGSATKLWAKFVILVAGVAANLDSIVDFLNMPDLKTFIDTYINNPKLIAAVMLIISLISIKARNRTA